MKFYTLTGVIMTGVTAAVLACHAAPAAAADSPLRYAPLRPMSLCLDPDRIRTWHFLDSDEMLVDAGRKHYLLQLSTSCPELTHSWQLASARATPSGGIWATRATRRGRGASLLTSLPHREREAARKEQFAQELELGAPATAGWSACVKKPVRRRMATGKSSCAAMAASLRCARVFPRRDGCADRARSPMESSPR